MTRYELRWSMRHPLRWLRHFWLHVALSVILAMFAFAWGHPVFDQVSFASVWPILISWVAGMVMATSLAPFSRWLNAVTGAALMTMGVLRALALLEVYLFGTATRAVVLALMAKEGLMIVVGVVWPSWTLSCGKDATVEAGVDDRGTDPEAGIDNWGGKGA